MAAALLEGMKLDPGSYLLAVIVFTVAFALMQPFLESQLRGVTLRRSEVSP